jgi:hypothetical protein
VELELEIRADARNGPSSDRAFRERFTWVVEQWVPFQARLDTVAVVVEVDWMKVDATIGTVSKLDSHRPLVLGDFESFATQYRYRDVLFACIDREVEVVVVAGLCTDECVDAPATADP